MGVLHHVIGRVKEGYRWIGNNPLKAAAIGGGVALGLGAAAVYGPSVAKGVDMLAKNPVVQAPFKIAAASKGPGLSGLSIDPGPSFTI